MKKKLQKRLEVINENLEKTRGLFYQLLGQKALVEELIANAKEENETNNEK